MTQNSDKQEVIGVFDRAAHLYGQVGTRQFTHFGNLLVDNLPIFPGASVLDIATGRGALLFAGAEKVGDTGTVIGIDLAPTMLKATQAEIQTRRLSQVSLTLMDADEIAFRSSSFDFILCGFALHFLDYEHTLPRFSTLLKPGGYFAAIMPFTPQSNEDFARWKWLFELTKKVFPPDFVPPSSWIAPRRLNTPELAEKALHEAGFIHVRTENHEAMLYFKDEADWWDWEWSQGSRFWLEGMSPEGLAQFRQEAFAHLRAMKEPAGIAMRDGALFAIGQKPTD